MGSTNRRCSFRSSMLLKENIVCQRLTPIITTLYDNTLTEFDMKNYIENGLRIIRFKSTKLTKRDKAQMLHNLRRAIESCCEKYEVTNWPVAVCIDLPNGSIYTGFLADDTAENNTQLNKDSVVQITSDLKYYSKCDTNRIFINDPYTLPTIPIGAEINLCHGRIIMFCIEIINIKTIKCKVTKEGYIHSQMKVCIRGIKLLKPPLSKRDLDVIQFGEENTCDIIIVNAVRRSKTIHDLRSLFKGSYKPLIFSSIYEQEGLDNMNEIIKASDGLILAREYLSWSLKKPDQLVKIQLQVGALCKMLEKPFFLSGNILLDSVVNERIMESDITDVSVAVQQGAGFLLRTYFNPNHVNIVLQNIKDICMDINSGQPKTQYVWELSYQIPLNAAEACIYSSAVLAEIAKAKTIVVLTVTGKTVKELSCICENIFIIAVTTDPVIARQLLLFRGVISVIYDNEAAQNWNNETDARTKFGAAHAMKFEILKVNNPFVVLSKGSSSSSYCDQVSVWHVTEEEQTRLQNKLKDPCFT